MSGAAPMLVAARPSRLRLALEVAVATAVSLVVTGFQWPLDNHAIQLPLAQLLGGSNPWPDDPFVATLDAYPSPVWALVGWLGAAIGLPAAVALAFGATRALFVIACGLLGAAWQPGRARLGWWGGLLGAAAAPGSLVGHGIVAPRSFEHTSLALALAVLAVAMWLRRRPLSTGAALGGAILANALYGGFAALFLVAHTVLRLRTDRPLLGVAGRLPESAAAAIVADWPSGRRWLAALGLAALVSAPAWLGGARLLGGSIGLDARWTELALLRFPHHLSAAAQGGAFVVAVLAWFGLATWGVRIRIRQPAHPVASWRHADRGRALLAIHLGCALAWGLGAIAGDLLRGPAPLLQLQLLRAGDVWLALVLPWAGGSALIWAAHRLPAAPAAAPPSGEAAAEAPPAASTTGPPRRWALAGGAVALAVAFARPDWRQVAIAVTAAAAIAALLRPRRPRGDAAGIVPAVLVALTLAGVSTKLSAPGTWFVGGPERLVYSEAATWIATEAPADAIVVCPVAWDHMRLLTQREVWVTWKDGSAILWAPEYAAVWSDRLAAVGVDPGEVPADPKARVAFLARRTDAISERLVHDIQRRTERPVVHVVLGSTRPLEPVAPFVTRITVDPETGAIVDVAGTP